ncbi:MAG: hypothetical protein HYY16_19390 [Planctomycetes bacterium]|nr:hypothetical protein [Planctomycetota bacterium]
MRRTVTAVIAAALAGCGFANPFDTTRDYRGMAHHDQECLNHERALLRMSHRPAPEDDQVPEAELHAWRSSVAVPAEWTLLVGMEADVRGRIDRLRERAEELRRQPPYLSQDEPERTEKELALEEAKLDVILARKEFMARAR